MLNYKDKLFMDKFFNTVVIENKNDYQCSFCGNNINKKEVKGLNITEIMNTIVHKENCDFLTLKNSIYI